MRPPRRFSLCFGIALFIFSSSARAEPKPLAALFQNSKAGKTKGKKAPHISIPDEYRVYFKARTLLEQPGELGAIEGVEKELLLTRLKAQNKNLDKELDEVFYALEIKRGAKFAKKKSWKQSFESFQRGLNGMGPFKWIYYWDSEDTKALSQVCKQSKKLKDDACLSLAKRVADAFPKGAAETKILRELPLADTSSGNSEGNGDRLSQTYTEKLEKDEDAFKEILEHYLSGKDIDLIKSVRDFLVEYPKSILRFRANFLMAESYNRTGSAIKAAPLYQSLIDQLPLSFYAIVSAERLGINLRERVKKDLILVDEEEINPNLSEKITLGRARALFAKRNFDEVGIELDSLTRVRSYNNSFLFYLMRFAHEANQNLTTFRFANELVGRKYTAFLNEDLLNMIFPDRYLKEVEEQATLNHVDPLVIVSLMKQESGFKAPILSSSGAAGLMQLMPFTAIDTKKDVVLSRLREPGVNVAVGTKYLASLLNRYEGNVPFALAAYNAGPHRVSKWRKDNKPEMPMIDWIESIPYKETRDYVLAILRNRYWYQYRKGVPAQSVFTVWKTPGSVEEGTPVETPAAVENAVTPTPTPASSTSSNAAAAPSLTPALKASPSASPSPAPKAN